MAFRLQGGLPKVGIRPTIDGRLGGVRESLEEITMNMARSVARLIGESLRHPSGETVESVIADRCIGGAAEAAQTAEKFARQGVGVSLTVTPCWCYGAETMDMDPLVPKAVWGFNGTERPGAVYLAAVLAGHNQKGLPAFGIYGRDVQDINDTTIPQDVRRKILQFVRSGLVLAAIRGKSYLAMGGVSMGIAGSVVDPAFLEGHLGMRYEMIDQTEFIRRIEGGIYDKAEAEKALAWVGKNCRVGRDVNPKKFSEDKKKKDWEFVVKCALIARDLMIGNPKLADMGFGEEAQGHNAIASGFQGQRQWTDTYPNGDFLETILNTSFDWNGIREPFICATENDYLNGITMVLMHMLSGSAQVFADVRTYWSPDAVKRVTGHKLAGDAAGGFLHLINSGSAALDGAGRQSRDGAPVMKPFWEITEAEVRETQEASSFCPAVLEYFRGGGFSTEFTTRGGMPVTMARINLIKGLGPVLQIAEGTTVDLPEKVNQTLADRTNPTWPTTWFVPRVTGKHPFNDVYSVMNNWGANHGVFGYGHMGSELITLASMLRIPVCMHNVPDEEVLRPAAWTHHGVMDPIGADYRACANFGPLYG